MIEFKCNECGADMETPDSLAGKLERCPKCQLLNRVPSRRRAGGPKPLLVGAVIAGVIAVAVVGYLAMRQGPPKEATHKAAQEPGPAQNESELARLRAENAQLNAKIAKAEAAQPPLPVRTANETTQPPLPVRAAPEPPKPSTPVVTVPESARKALATLKRLQAKTEMGMNFRDYSSELANTWAEIKPFLDSQDAKANTDLSLAIEAACSYYREASFYWQIANEWGSYQYGDFRAVGVSYEVIMQLSWRLASLEIDSADATLKRDNAQVLSLRDRIVAARSEREGELKKAKQQEANLN